MTDKTSIEEITGYLGVGALELLAVFFILDGTSGFLEFVETYAKTSSWAIFVTGPVLVISYVLGLISSLASESLLKGFLGRKPTTDAFFQRLGVKK